MGEFPLMPDVRYCRGFIMIQSADIRAMKTPLNHGAGQMPVLGFGNQAEVQSSGKDRQPGIHPTR